MRYADVAVQGPFREPLVYAVPSELGAEAVRGVRVLVPFRGRARVGVLMSRRESPPDDVPVSKIREIADVIDAEPLLRDPQLALTEWIGHYYRGPIGECVRLALPSGTDIVGHRTLGPTEAIPERAELDGWPDAARAAYELIAAHGSVRVDELLRQDRQLRQYHLSALERDGWVVSQYDSTRAGARAKMVLRVTRTEKSSEDGRLGSRQVEVLTFLDEHGDATNDELRDLFGTPRAVLRSLAGRGLVELAEEEAYRDPFDAVETATRETDPVLTRSQEKAVSTVRDAIAARKGDIVLLHGVTGSGKTEVYVRAMRTARAKELGCLLLLPEIALTPQTVAVFRAAFGDQIAVQHSGLSPGERFDQWRRIRRGELRIVIGARSALFAPIERLGLIIIDEEHDGSFKQEDGVRYHARDSALVLAKRARAAVILGSATPSLESYRNATEGRFVYAAMPRRVAGRPMPEVEMIDMRDHPADDDDPCSGFLSTPLQAAVRDVVDAGEQAIIFLNRRGFAPFVQCEACGESIQCHDCDISLTYHDRGRRLRCHYCGASHPMPERCPTCGSEELEKRGYGTQQIEQGIASAFDGMRVGRLDRDTSRGSGLESLLGRFRQGDLDVLVGTQMVTKGHDFPGVTLVGVVNADQSLRFPDFRSGERTFQLLTQVAGRAGRAERPGRVLVQSFNPDHYALRAARRHDFESFAARELRFRERLQYPPYGYMIAVRLDGPDDTALLRLGRHIADYVQRHKDRDVRILGPVRSPLARVRRRYRVQMTARGSDRAGVRYVAQLVEHYADSARREIDRGDIRLVVDVDPLSLL